jgi:hypothetical protein
MLHNFDRRGFAERSESGRATWAIDPKSGSWIDHQANITALGAKTIGVGKAASIAGGRCGQHWPRAD